MPEMRERRGHLVEIAPWRAILIGMALALAALLLGAREATGGQYSVAQCGWHVGADAGWADNTGGRKFRRSSYCATSPGADPLDGVHLKTLTKGPYTTVAGTRFGRWRWEAPPGTGISKVSGTWWHALHDGMQQRIGVGTWSGGFKPFAIAGSTNTTPRAFVAGFSTPQPALEDRLLCARGPDRWCSISPRSVSAVRALTITIVDNHPPRASLGGEITGGGWRRGSEGVEFWGSDKGGGARLSETSLDGARLDRTEHGCGEVLVGGERRGTRMRPCPTEIDGSATIDTTRFSDGKHSLRHCLKDFAGNLACTGDTTVRIDNNAPAGPLGVSLAGGDGWRSVNDFDLSWGNPGQGEASPIGGAHWQVRGPAGFDSGVKLAEGRDIEALADRKVPGPGEYRLRLWLRDEAGNSDPGSAAEVTLRLDDAAPGVAFEAAGGAGMPAEVAAEVADAHSGPARGSISYRPLRGSRWAQLPTELAPGARPGEARLLARVPADLRPGTYLFRAEAVDAAGNSATTTRRADGTRMTLRKEPPPPPPAPQPDPSRSAGGAVGSGTAKGPSDRGAKAGTRLVARLRHGRRSGRRVTVPFGGRALLVGRLLDARGRGLGGRALRIVSRFPRGAAARGRVRIVRTGARGRFRVALRRGPTRRLNVVFRGDGRHAGSRRPGLLLRARGGAVLRAAPQRLRTGESLLLRGRVRSPGAPLPRRGKLIAVQYYETEARRWRPVLVTRADRKGRFRARYRFRYVTGTARILLRALVLPEGRWPYAPGASRPLTVWVRG